MRLTGVTIELQELTQTGVDAFNRPTCAEAWIEVENVLIAPAGSSEITDSQDISGRRAVYQLAIPKGDAHVWENRLVRFFGETWRVIKKPVRGIDALIPLDWNLKVEVESLVSTESEAGQV